LLERQLLPIAAAYLRRTPIEKGRWRLLHHFLPLLRQFGATMGQKTVRTRYGFRMRLDLADWLGQYIYLTGGYEPSTARLIAGLIQPGDTVIDIGANAGFFTLLAATRVRESGRVLAFEPIPAVRAALETNIKLNGVHWVSLHGTALSNAAGTLTMYEGPRNHRGLSSLRPLDRAAATHIVAVKRLDDWLPVLDRVKLIKLDVEGAEQHVVEGMAALISRDMPYIVVEVTDAYLQKMGHSATSLLSLLNEKGYQIYRIGDDGLRQIKDPSATLEAQFNALCCPAGRFPEPLASSLTQ
jgi:FkbM family methyltransferase